VFGWLSSGAAGHRDRRSIHTGAGVGVENRGGGGGARPRDGSLVAIVRSFPCRVLRWQRWVVWLGGFHVKIRSFVF